jgi:hypothetical protein
MFMRTTNDLDMHVLPNVDFHPGTKPSDRIVRCRILAFMKTNRALVNRAVSAVRSSERDSGSRNF